MWNWSSGGLAFNGFSFDGSVMSLECDHGPVSCLSDHIWLWIKWQSLCGLPLVEQYLVSWLQGGCCCMFLAVMISFSLCLLASSCCLTSLCTVVFGFLTRAGTLVHMGLPNISSAGA